MQLYDFGVNDTGSFYYVMELLDGLDLNQIVTRFGPQPAERVAMLLGQACRSLAEAHEHGLVHRDIKPANLFVACLGPEYDYLKVLDFGIVKDRPGQEAMLLTAQGMVQGTPAFMAPEMVLGETEVDGRADLYSLACVAYWALTGQLVFAAKTPEQMLLHHAQTTPVPPSQVSELPIPRAIDEIVMRCLAKSPDDRPASALDLEAALSGVAFDRPWTQERAREWWELHVPGIRMAKRTLSNLVMDRVDKIDSCAGSRSTASARSSTGTPASTRSFVRSPATGPPPSSRPIIAFERALEAESPHRLYRDVLTTGVAAAAEEIGVRRVRQTGARIA